jgi:tetratricopeptide (TPR) repeat protein
MLETLREYAADRLEEADEAEQTRQRHANYFLALASAAAPELDGRDQLRWFDRVEAEHNNFAAALAHLEHAAPAEGLKLVSALRLFWSARGHTTEGREWAERLLARNPEKTNAAHAEGLKTGGFLAMDTFDRQRATRMLEQALQLYQALGDESGVASCLTGIGWLEVSLWDGDFQRAGDLAEQAAEIARRVGPDETLRRALDVLSLSLMRRGQTQRADAVFEEVLALEEHTGAWRSMALTLLNQGYFLAHDSPAKGVRLLKKAATLAAELDDRATEFTCLGNLGLANIYAANHTAAKEAFAMALTGTGADVATERMSLGEIFLGLASIYAEEEPDVAGRLVGAVDALGLIREPGASDAPFLHEHYLASARNDRDFSSAYEEGRAMTLEETIAYGMRVATQEPLEHQAGVEPPHFHAG